MTWYLDGLKEGHPANILITTAYRLTGIGLFLLCSELLLRRILQLPMDPPTAIGGYLALVYPYGLFLFQSIGRLAKRLGRVVTVFECLLLALVPCALITVLSFGIRAYSFREALSGLGIPFILSSLAFAFFARLKSSHVS